MSRTTALHKKEAARLAASLDDEPTMVTPLYVQDTVQVREMLTMGTVLSTVPGAVQCTVQDTVRGTVQGAVCLACMYIVNMDTCNMYGHAHRYVRTRAQNVR